MLLFDEDSFSGAWVFLPNVLETVPLADSIYWTFPYKSCNICSHDVLLCDDSHHADTHGEQQRKNSVNGWVSFGWWRMYVLECPFGIDSVCEHVYLVQIMEHTHPTLKEVLASRRAWHLVVLPF